MKKYRPTTRTYKLFDLIEALDKNEVRKLKKFLKSPFFLLRKDVPELYDFLLQVKAKGKGYPPIEYLDDMLFPGEAHDPVRIRGVMSDLLELIEQYLVITHNKEEEVLSRLVLSKVFRQRHLKKSFEGNLKKTENLLNQYPEKTENYYQHLLDYQQENMKYAITNRRTAHLFFQEISQTNDILYLIRKLRAACSQLTHQSVYKTEYDEGLLKYFEQEIEESKYLEVPAVAIYYYCYRFLQGKKSLIYFQKYKETLTNSKSHFNKEDLKGHYRLGINYCIRKLNEGDKEFTREGLELYKEGVREAVLVENNRISRFTFNNMVAFALQLREFEWVENFITTHEKMLDKAFRRQTVMFNLARLKFFQGRFGEALMHLQEAEHKDLVNNLIAKMLQAKIYYELKEFDTLESFLDSFSQFIRRREVSDYHRNNFLNNIKVIRKLMSLPSYSKSEKGRLRESIKQESLLSEREWLLEKTA